MHFCGNRGPTTCDDATDKTCRGRSRTLSGDIEAAATTAIPLRSLPRRGRSLTRYCAQIGVSQLAEGLPRHGGQDRRPAPRCLPVRIAVMKVSGTQPPIPLGSGVRLGAKLVSHGPVQAVMSGVVIAPHSSGLKMPAGADGKCAPAGWPDSFAYLRSLKPVSNAVRATLPPAATTAAKE